MKTYKKKPVEVQAIQWDGTPEAAGSIIDWIMNNSLLTAAWTETYPDGEVDGEKYSGREEGIYINTLEGSMRVSPKDWIIKGNHGEFYPCKPWVFADTYEEV